MVITQARVVDLDEFYPCFEEVMKEGYAGYSKALITHFTNNDYSKNNFYIWLERFLRVVYIAKEDGRTVGFIVGDNTYGGVAFVSWLGVLQDYRKKGIGASLYNTYENFALSRKAHLIELYTYSKVQPFYLKLGFMEIGHREEGYFGQPNIIMNKVLGKWSDSNIPTPKV